MKISYRYIAISKQNFAYKYKMQGMTLVELMITLAIVAVATSVAIPMFSNTLARNRNVAYINEFLTSLKLTRSEAITRGQRVVICKSSDAQNCATSGDWEQGWVIFLYKSASTDAGGNPVVNTGSGDVILRVHSALGSNMTLKGGTTNVSTYIAYSSDGGARLVGGDAQTGTISLCYSDNSSIKNAVVINAVGRARTDSSSASCP